MNFDPTHFFKETIRNISNNRKDKKTVKHDAGILLNANENSFGSPLIKWYNRFDKSNEKLINGIAAIKAVEPGNIVLGNGNAACIDLLVRSVCHSGINNAIIFPPTDKIYQNVLELNEITVKKVPLNSDFLFDLIHLEQLVDDHTKIIFIASPNNPTGNAIAREDIEMVLNNFNGIVLLDETYINFSKQKSFVTDLADYSNLIVLQNFDIAWGLAGLNVAMLLASSEICKLLNGIQPTCVINTPTQELLLEALEEVGMVNDMIKELAQMKAALKRVLEKFPFVEKVFPSETNFLLLKLTDAASVYHFLLAEQILVKDVSDYEQCENCLRITIGTEDENTKLVEALVAYFDHVHIN